MVGRLFFCIFLALVMLGGVLAEACADPAAVPPSQGPQFRLTEIAPTKPAATPASTAVPSRDPRAVLRGLPAFEASPSPTPHRLDVPVPPVATRLPSLSPTASPPSSEASVVSYGPRGEVPLATSVYVTFAKPIAGLGSTVEPPVEIVPRPAGRWRWLDTRSAIFDPAGGRMPMATLYSVSVHPPGGAPLQWTFSTTPPAVIGHGPPTGEPVATTLFYVTFDQKVVPGAVLPLVRTVPPVPLRLATDEERKQCGAISPDLADRTVAFCPVSQFPGGTKITVQIGPRVPSAEGNRVSLAREKFSFTTVSSSLHVTSGRLSEDYRFNYTLKFTNPLNAEQLQEQTFSPWMVDVTPKLDDFSIWGYGSTLYVSGKLRYRTAYTLRLSPRIQDVAGHAIRGDKEFRVRTGRARSALWLPPADLYTVNPLRAVPEMELRSVNVDALRVQIYAVKPSDWPRYAALQGRSAEGRIPGTLVRDEIIHPKTVRDEGVFTLVDLRRALKNGLGHAIVVVEQPGVAGRQYMWVQSTHIDLHPFVERGRLTLWMTSLLDRSPLDGVTVQVMERSAQAVSDSRGLAELEFPTTTGDANHYKMPADAVVVARKGEDTALLSQRTTQRDDELEGGSLLWWATSDRGLYRPGETVHVKGWLRRVSDVPPHDIEGIEGRIGSVGARIEDLSGRAIAHASSALDASGGFDFSFSVPTSTSEGAVHVVLEAGGASVRNRVHRVQIQVQSYRRPEFEVSVSNGGGPCFVGRPIDLHADAHYFDGGAMAKTPLTWWALVGDAFLYHPPTFADYQFTTDYSNGSRYSIERSKLLRSQTDREGHCSVRVEIDPSDAPHPFELSIQPLVKDFNHRAWSANRKIIVHPADEYVGLHAATAFVRLGARADVSAIVTHIDGKPVAGRTIQIESARLEWVKRNGDWEQEPVSSTTQSVTSTPTPTSFSVTPNAPGVWRIRASIVDTSGRRNQADIRLWVTDDNVAPEADGPPQRLRLVLDRPRYEVGDVAHVLVVSPYVRATGLLRVLHRGQIETRVFAMQGVMTTLDVPVVDGVYPGLALQVMLCGTASGAEPWDLQMPGPHSSWRAEEVSLNVSSAPRELSVSVRPADEHLRPGGSVPLVVTVHDAYGLPLKAGQICLTVVDDAVLALNPSFSLNPVYGFYPNDLTPWLRLLLGVRFAGEFPEGAIGGGAIMIYQTPGSGPLVAMRQSFDPLALFAPSLPLDSHGQARTTVHLPDTLTRYRVMVAATDGARRFGVGQSTLTASLPLTVRPSAPRFLRSGDRFEIPVIVQNNSDAPMAVEVAARASHLHLDGDGWKASIAPHDRVAVSFQGTSGEVAPATIQVVARAGAISDAAQSTVPVLPAATRANFATYGTVEADEETVAQPVDLPADGRIEVSLSATATASLSEAVRWILEYPYGCSEQISSRLLAALAVPATASEQRRLLQEDIQRLATRQNTQGAFGLWSAESAAMPFVSVHATHALLYAKRAGLAVSEETLHAALNYLRTLNRDAVVQPLSPADRLVVRAYAASVLAEAARGQSPHATRLAADGLKSAAMSLDAAAWLLPLVDAASVTRRDLLGFIENRAVLSPASATFVVAQREDKGWLVMSDERRTDALILDALLRVNPRHPLVTPLARGLAAARHDGHWRTTQATVFAVLALHRYFELFEKQTPNFNVQAWIAGNYLGQKTFDVDATTATWQASPLTATGATSVVLQKRGKGRLYYRVGLTVPQTAEAGPVDAGFQVTRTYSALDDPADVSRAADGTWRCRAGSRVRVKLTVRMHDARRYVALVDPMPAGLEPADDWVARERKTQTNTRGWITHENIRDDRAEVFADQIEGGVYTFTYDTRAVTCGTYHVPPARAEEMYAPEVFGQTESGRVEVIGTAEGRP